MTTQKPPTKTLMIVYYLSFLYLGMGVGILGPTVPHLAKQINVGLDTFSYVFIASSIGGILGSLIGSRGYDRWDGHKIMGASLFASTLFKFLIPLTGSFWLMLVLLFFLVFFHITFDSGGNTLLIWWWGDKVGPHMNTTHFTFGAGAILSPLLVGQVLAITGEVTWAYWTLALLGIPISIALFLMPSPKIPTAENEANGKIKRPQMTLIWFFILIFILYIGAEVSFGDWIYTYAISTNLADPINATYLSSLFWGGLTFGTLITIPLAARFPIWKVLLGSVIGAVGSVILMLFVPTSIWVGTALLGLTFASVWPLTISWASSTMHINGKITGWLFAGANIGAMIFPWFVGQFFVTISPAIMLWTVLLIAVCMIGVINVLQHKIYT